jgi:uncharacterized membrane protein YdbT with pleckstrin-like domain
MSYVKDTLLPGERIVLMGKVHWIVFVPGILMLALSAYMIFQLWQGVVGFIVGIFGLASFFRGLIYYFTTELAITDRRVIAKFGFIARITFELNLTRVTSLTVDQSISGRILNYGNIAVIGMGGMSTPIRDIVNPLGFRRLVLGEVEGRERV